MVVHPGGSGGRAASAINHAEGVTILGLLFPCKIETIAAHQLKVLFAIIKCEQLAIALNSAIVPPRPVYGTTPNSSQ